jgi:hypothetical protein
VGVIESGNLPREEIDKWINDQPSELTEALLDPENKSVEEALKKVNKPLKKSDHKSKADNPSDEDYQEEVEPSLPSSSVGDALKSLSTTTDILINSSSDQEAIYFLVAKAKAKLWERCFIDEEAAISEAQQHQGNVYSEAVRDIFIEEHTRCKQLPLPEGYSFTTDNSGIFRYPKLMQRLIAYRVLKEGRVLNLSGTGTGKTLSAVLASRVIGAKLTVIACPNSTVGGWEETIKKAFPNSNVVTKDWHPRWNKNDFPCYLVINHEMFQNRYLSAIKNFIQNHPIDFIVIDELHQVKQREADEESQRRRLLNGLITDVPKDRPKPRVLGMSATPIINNLQEGKSLVELVSSKTQDDIGTKATVPNCMKLYQKFTTMGFRMIPKHQQSRVPKIYPIDATPFTAAKATQYWMGWLRRIEQQGLNEIERKEIRVPLDETSEAETSRRYASYGDFATLNARWNNTYSSTTHNRLRNNPEEWCFYHTRMDELEANWQVNPREECIKHLKVNLPRGSVVGDFGCGQAKLAEALKDIHTVNSYDHIAINPSVYACDMLDTPLDDNTLDAAVFSLSLMGTNLKDYILEAYRTLKPGGQLLIYHPAQTNDRDQFASGLTQLGFAIVQSVEIYKWHYIWAIKQGQQENPDASIGF